MPKSIRHAEDSVKRHGGKVEDYLPIHDLMDSSKTALSDNRHRALTHNHWFIATIVERIFGNNFTNSDGKVISTRQIGEEHCLMDYAGRFIPTAQDFLTNIEYESWMDNGNGFPQSAKKIEEFRQKKKEKVMENVLHIEEKLDNIRDVLFGEDKPQTSLHDTQFLDGQNNV